MAQQPMAEESLEAGKPPGADGDPAPAAMMDAATCADPHELYKALREGTPVLRVDRMVVVSRRAEMEEVFRNPNLYSSDSEMMSLGNVRPLIPLQIDPPNHVQYRRILDPIFAPKQIAKLEDRVSALAGDLIDRFAADGRCDLVPAFTVPFPSEVFLTLLGLPLSDLPIFLKMKDGIIRPPGATLSELSAHRAAAGQDIYAYFEKVIAERRIQPRDDLVSQFLVTEVEGRQLSHDEILDICFLFLIAGLDTVSATLECMFAYLAQHPSDRQLIADDPSVIPTAVEELLRWDTPVMGVARMATEETELGGEAVHAGDPVSVLLGAPNMEPGDLVDPERLDLRRTSNRHVAFGAGVHRCLGSHLARLELRSALREFHRRIPEYHLEPGATLNYSPGIRSIEHLPLVFGPTPS